MVLLHELLKDDETSNIYRVITETAQGIAVINYFTNDKFSMIRKVLDAAHNNRADIRQLKLSDEQIAALTKSGYVNKAK